MKYYAKAIDIHGRQLDLEVEGKGYLICNNMNLVSLESNAKFVNCHNNNLTSLKLPNAKFVNCHNNNLTSLKLPNAKVVYCENNNLKSLKLPNATNVYCDNNQLTSLDLPNVIEVYCHNNNLTSLVKNCGNEKRTIWSQKIDKIIYTYIGCGRFTLHEAIESINKKYTGKDAEDYINKVKLSQSLVD